jgi:hypothetical protein
MTRIPPAAGARAGVARRGDRIRRFRSGVALALALAFADGIPKKMCAVFDSQLPPFFRAIADAVPAGRRWPW